MLEDDRNRNLCDVHGTVMKPGDRVFYLLASNSRSRPPVYLAATVVRLGKENRRLTIQTDRPAPLRNVLASNCLRQLPNGQLP